MLYEVNFFLSKPHDQYPEFFALFDYYGPNIMINENRYLFVHPRLGPRETFHFQHHILPYDVLTIEAVTKHDMRDYTGEVRAFALKYFIPNWLTDKY